MNRRIQELARLSGMIAGEQDNNDFKKTLTQKELKFAELIMKECADIAFAGKSDNLDDYDRGWQNGRNTVSYLIKEHFRDEE